jgi:hypothetical protein
MQSVGSLKLAFQLKGLRGGGSIMRVSFIVVCLLLFVALCAAIKYEDVLKGRFKDGMKPDKQAMKEKRAEMLLQKIQVSFIFSSNTLTILQRKLRRAEIMNSLRR